MTRTFTITEFKEYLEAKETNNIKFVVASAAAILLSSAFEIITTAEKVVEAVDWF